MFGILCCYLQRWRYPVVQLVEAQSYKPEGRRFSFYLLNPSGRTVALGSTQPLTNEYQEYKYILGLKAAGA